MLILLEAVADAQCDVTPVEISVGNEVETRTDVERELDRYSVEFVFDTGLTEPTFVRAASHYFNDEFVLHDFDVWDKI